MWGVKLLPFQYSEVQDSSALIKVNKSVKIEVCWMRCYAMYLVWHIILYRKVWGSVLAIKSSLLQMEKGEFLELQINLQWFNTFLKKTLISIEGWIGGKCLTNPLSIWIIFIKCQLITTFFAWQTYLLLSNCLYHVGFSCVKGRMHILAVSWWSVSDNFFSFFI